MRVILLNKNQVVPRKQLGREWENLEEWWPDMVTLYGRDLPGQIICDETNDVGIIAVIKFKSSEDTVSVRKGLEKFADIGHKNVEIISTEGMQTTPPVRKKKPRPIF